MRADAFEPRNGSFGVLGIVLGVIQLWVVAMTLILAAAFVMGLLGANPDAGFTSWIYGRTDTIMKPFTGIFDPVTLTEGTVIRTSLLFAIVVYAAITAMIDAVRRRM